MTFDDVFTYEHMLVAAKECIKNVKWKRSTQMFWANRYSTISKVRRQLIEGTWRSKGFHTFIINERGKTRKIQAVHITERVVQKCLRKFCLNPIIIPKLIYTNSASLPGKGTHFALKQFESQLRHHLMKYGVSGGVLSMDIHNYFGSIDHDILKAQLNKIIDDSKLLKLSEYFVDCFDGNKGIGLGSEVSQIYGLLYLNDFDHFVKEQLHIEEYGRYNDDIYLIHNNLEHLKYCYKILSKMLIDDYRLEVNKKKTCLHAIGKESIVFLKKRFIVTKTKKILVKPVQNVFSKRRRTLKKQFNLLKDGKILVKSIKDSYVSWRSSISKTNAKKSLHSMDALFNKFIMEA